MSEETAECTDAKSQLETAKAETSNLNGTLYEKTSKMEDALTKLSEARAAVESASREAGQAQDDVGRAREVLRQQKDQNTTSGYPGDSDHVSDLEAKVAAAESRSRDADAKRDAAVSQSQSAQYALDSARSDRDSAANDYRSAQARESRWKDRVSSVCK